MEHSSLPAVSECPISLGQEAVAEVGLEVRFSYLSVYFALSELHCQAASRTWGSVGSSRTGQFGDRSQPSQGMKTQSKELQNESQTYLCMPTLELKLPKEEASGHESRCVRAVEGLFQNSGGCHVLVFFRKYQSKTLKTLLKDEIRVIKLESKTVGSRRAQVVSHVPNMCLTCGIGGRSHLALLVAYEHYLVWPSSSHHRLLGCLCL